MLQKNLKITFLMLKTGKNRQNYILSNARFSPALQGNTADKTEFPAVFPVNGLNIRSSMKNRNHGLSFLNQRCCSTNPEEGWGE
jgi:hypothetical protein